MQMRFWSKTESDCAKKIVQPKKQKTLLNQLHWSNYTRPTTAIVIVVVDLLLWLMKFYS